MAGRRSARGGFGLFLLASEIMRIGPNRIPPVTLITVVINVVIYMKVIPKLPSVHGACTSNNLVVNRKQWFRLCTSSFYHLDDWHLYYNMVSFVWKGKSLEPKMKSKKFLIVIALFSVLTQVVMLILNQLFSEIFSSRDYLMTCAAGFSAVIFALKVLTTYDSNANVGVMYLPFSVPSRYACWVELVLIHILVPNSSFTGHLAGILVGLMYTLGPLKKLVSAFKHLISSGTGLRNAGHRGPAYNYQSEATGYHDPDDSVLVQRAIQESMRNTHFTNQGSSHTRSRPPPSYGWNISEEPTNQQNAYPNIPRNEHEAPGSSGRSYPSAPPYYADHDSGQTNYPPYPTTSTGNLPYPHANNSPYPTRTNPLYPSLDNNNEETQSSESPEEVMRKARLRKFTTN